MAAGRVPRAAWEGSRWCSPVKLLAVSGITALCYVIDTCTYLGAFAGQNTSVLFYFLASSNSMFENLGLCLMAFLGAGMYAQDYEEGAVYMRVQRLGGGKYAALRTWQASSSAFAAGALGLLLAFFLAAAITGNPALPSLSEVNEVLAGVSENRVLLGGHVIPYMVSLLMLAGLRSMFYSVLTLAVTLAIPRRRMLAAVPMLLWYVFQYFWPHGVPAWLKPSVLFDLRHNGMNGRILFGRQMPEWAVLGITSGGMVLLAAIVWLLFCLRMGRNGIFGGEEE